MSTEERLNELLILIDALHLARVDYEFDGHITSVMMIFASLAQGLLLMVSMPYLVNVVVTISATALASYIRFMNIPAKIRETDDTILKLKLVVGSRDTATATDVQDCVIAFNEVLPPIRRVQYLKTAHKVARHEERLRQSRAVSIPAEANDSENDNEVPPVLKVPLELYGRHDFSFIERMARIEIASGRITPTGLGVPNYLDDWVTLVASAIKDGSPMPRVNPYEEYYVIGRAYNLHLDKCSATPWVLRHEVPDLKEAISANMHQLERGESLTVPEHLRHYLGNNMPYILTSRLASPPALTSSTSTLSDPQEEVSGDIASELRSSWADGTSPSSPRVDEFSFRRRLA